MAHEDLLARNPTIREAVAFVELCADLPVLREAVRQGMPLQELVRWLSEAMDENSAEDGPPNVARLVKAKAQCRLPEFRTYLAGRLGLMGSKAAERRGAGGPSTFD